MAGISGVSTGASLNDAAGIEKLIQQMMVLEQRPVTQLQQRKDELEIRHAIFDDITQKMEAARSAINALTASSTGAFKQYSASSSNESVVDVSVGTNPAAGQYDIVIDHLAQAHQLSSNQVAQAGEALGWSGTFVIGGAAARAVADKSIVENTVADFGAGGSIRSGQRELGTGQYYVEVRYYQDTTWQFRLVDEDGSAVSIDDAEDTDTAMTTAWQDLAQVAGTTFDTGRGLTIGFGNGPYTAGLKGTGAASVHYTAQGASITVAASESLNDIRDAINAATYAEGNQVVASVVDRRLILTGSRSGSSASVAFTDTTGTIMTGNLGMDRRSAAGAQDLASDNGVTSFGIANLLSFTGGELNGQVDLSPGRYYVEIGSADHANQFRLVDANGDAVAIASSNGGTMATTDWIDISDGIYDTGRGLTLSFAGGGTYTPTTIGSNAANVSYDTAILQSPRDATLTVNGLSMNRGGNVGLTDIIQGLSLNLHAPGNSKIGVTRDSDAVMTGARTLVNKVNDLLAYIRTKTEPQLDQSSSVNSAQPIYKQAPLSSDWTLRGLRRNLTFDLLSTYSGAAPGAPSTLADIGITLDDDAEGSLAFEVSNQSALESALSQDFEGVSDLFDHILGQLEQRLATYLDGDNAYIASSQNGIDDQVDQIDHLIESAQARLARREESLRKQFFGYQAQIMSMQYESQSMQTLMFGSLYNQQM